MLKQSVPIDRLLSWALSDMAIDKVAKVRFDPRGPASSCASGLGEFMALGARIDASSFAERVLGAERQMESPDMRDALRVFEAAFAVQERWLEIGEHEVTVWTERDAGLVLHAIEVVDEQRAWLRPAPGSPLFGKSAGCWLRRCFVVGAVLSHAKGGDAPDWGAEVQGRLKTVAGRRKAGVKPGAVDDVAYAAGAIREARGHYRAWHGALCEMIDLLAGGLERHVAVEPSAPSKPWKVKMGKNHLKTMDKTQVVDGMRSLT